MAVVLHREVTEICVDNVNGDLPAHGHPGGLANSYPTHGNGVTGEFFNMYNISQSLSLVPSTIDV